jgi:Gpi18-like mannosyltransferase
MFEGRIIRAALVAFFTSRVLVFAVMICGSQIEFVGKEYSNSVWRTRIDLSAERLLPELERVAMVGDAWWYRSIATGGYSATPPNAPTPNWAFFPLYPKLASALPFSSFAVSGMVLSNVAFGFALVLLGVLARRYGLASEDAERAIFYVAFFPTSYFFSLPMTESLFLALSLGCVLAGREGRWWIAGLLGGLAALTRFPGLLLMIPLALLFFVERREKKFAHVAALALVPAGTAAFMWYLRQVANDPFAFANVQGNWGRSPGWFWRPLVAYLADPSHVGSAWNLVTLNFLIALLLVVAAIALLVRRQWSMGAYTLASVLLPLSTSSLQSIARYALVIFPFFFVLAVAGRRPLADRALFGSSVFLLGWLVALLTLGVDFALA